MDNPKGIPLPRLLRVEDLLVPLQMSRAAIYEAARRGLLPHVRIGRSIRFSPDAIQEFIARGGAREAT